MAQADIRNSILNSLSSKDFALIKPKLRPVDLGLRKMLEVAHEPIKSVFFPNDGIASVVATMSKGRQIEVGVIGHDGMTGTAIVLGADQSPNDTFIQVAGSGFEMSVSDTRRFMAENATLRSVFLRYVNSFLNQTAQTALVNAHLKIEERLARWLLVVHDRVEGKTLRLTHEFLATMLGVRRPGVTLAIQMLEYRGLIQAKRSEIAIIDRQGLVKLTNGGYAADCNDPAP